MKITKNHVMKPSALALAISAASMNVSALEFHLGDLEGQWDNSISYGAAMRLEDPDKRQVAKYGTGIDGASASSYNFDDGNLNFEQGELYTNVIKASTDLELVYKNYGGFFRGRAYYDTELVDGERPWKDLNDASIDAAGKGYELMDAFVWADYDIGEMPTSFRVGRQVLSWGESTFIQGGINSVNPVDASAFRKPGAELKEGLLPVNLAYVSLGLTENVSMEAFYQLQWEKTRPDPCGTFFSTVDFVSDGCGPVILGGTAGEQSILNSRASDIENGIPLGERRFGAVAERLEDDEAKDDGQYGVAFRWYAEALGDTEFGFYHMNIHSRLPVIAGNIANPYHINGTTVYDPAGATVTNANNVPSTYPQYQIVYPEDIKLTGVSFSRTTESGYSISGEVSLKQDVPMQHNSFEILLAGNLLPTSKLFVQRVKEEIDPNFNPNNPVEVAAAKAQFGGNSFEGFDRFDIWQAQTTVIKFFDQVMGADRLTIAAEAGINYIQDLPSLDEARYGRSGTFGIGDFDPVVAVVDTDATNAIPDGTPLAWYTCDANETVASGVTTAQGVDGAGGSNENPANCNNDGYVDELSGGIRIKGKLDFNNAFAGVNMAPVASIAYDVGNGPEPGSQFIDGRLTTALGVKFDYLSKYSAGITYTNFSGGGRYNVVNDRDNLAINASMSF